MKALCLCICQSIKCIFKILFAGKSDLTVDALKLHNDLQTGPLELAGSRKDASMEEDEEEQIEGFSDRTSGTFLSGLSDCSNLTFRKVQRYWESNSAAHKEVRPCNISHAFTQQEKYNILWLVSQGVNLEYHGQYVFPNTWCSIVMK